MLQLPYVLLLALLAPFFSEVRAHAQDAACARRLREVRALSNEEQLRELYSLEGTCSPFTVAMTRGALLASHPWLDEAYAHFSQAEGWARNDQEQSRALRALAHLWEEVGAPNEAMDLLLRANVRAGRRNGDAARLQREHAQSNPDALPLGTRIRHTRPMSWERGSPCAHAAQGYEEPVQHCTQRELAASTTSRVLHVRAEFESTCTDQLWEARGTRLRRLLDFPCASYDPDFRNHRELRATFTRGSLRVEYRDRFQYEVDGYFERRTSFALGSCAPEGECLLFESVDDRTSRAPGGRARPFIPFRLVQRRAELRLVGPGAPPALRRFQSRESLVALATRLAAADRRPASWASHMRNYRLAANLAQDEAAHEARERAALEIFLLTRVGMELAQARVHDAVPLAPWQVTLHRAEGGTRLVKADVDADRDGVRDEQWFFDAHGGVVRMRGGSRTTWTPDGWRPLP